MFFVNTDYSKEIQKAKIHLAKPNKSIISHIHERYGVNLSVKLGNIYELTFSIPHFVNEGFEIQKNPHVETLKEKMLLRVSLGGMIEWFIVDSIEEDGNDTDIFNVTAFSLGYELSHKRIGSYIGEGKSCKSMANEILESSTWKVGSIDAVIQYRSAVLTDENETKRTLEVSGSNALDGILQVAEAFGAVPIWDTENKTVSFKSLKNIGTFKGMTVDYGRLLSSINRSRTTDELVTRMYAFGNDDLTIAGVNTTGQMYIEDFSFFLYPFERDANKNVISKSYFMSDALCHAILNHKELVQTHSAEINSLMSEVINKQLNLQTEKTNLSELQLELQSIEYRLDTAKAVEDQPLISSIESERMSKQSELSSQEAVLSALQSELNADENRVSSLRDAIASQAGFNTLLYDELNYYIIEKEWRDERYIDADELYEDALERFITLREPKVVLTVDIENLFEIMEEQYYWDKLELGDLIKIRYPQMDIEYMAQIIEINYDFDNGSISIVIANTEKTGNEMDKLKELLSKSQSTSTLLENSKYKWDKVLGIEDEVYRLINDEWDANKRKIVAGVNNQIEIGNRGIIIRNPDNPEEVVIMQAGIIALSMDGGDTWKTAIKPDGIIAERIIGNLIAGRNLIITNGNGTFTVDEDGVRVVGTHLEITGGLPASQLDQDYVNNVNFQIQEAKEATEQLHSDVEDMLSDAFITQLESKTLELSLKRLVSESVDIVNIATTLNIIDEKDNYTTSLTNLETYLKLNYINKDNSAYPISVTSDDRSAIESHFSILENTKSILVNKITQERENNAIAYVDDMKSIIDGEMEDVQGVIDDLRGYVGDSFRDGVIQESEAQSIGVYLNSLSTEKEDLDNRYTFVYANSALVDATAKSSLLTNKGSYNVAHQNLLASINNAISDRRATEEESRDVDEKFVLYKNALANLSVSFERAIDAIGIEKSRIAEVNAKNASVGKGEVLNGVRIDAQNGMVVTTSDSKTKVITNATRGFAIQKNTGSSSSPNYSDVFAVDTDGNIVMKSGIITWGDVNAPSATQTGALPVNSQMLTKITANGVYTGTITTSQLVVGTAKISTALIDNLVVGTNVTMGANAYISWGNITSRPTIPSTAGEVGAIASTYIDSSGIWTGYLNASKITTGTFSADHLRGGTITGTNINGVTITGSTINGGNINIDTDLYVGNNIYLAKSSSYLQQRSIIFAQSASVTYNSDTMTISAVGAVELYASRITMRGTLDLTNTSSINWGNHRPTAVFG